ACFSRIWTSIPARASKYPSIIPAGPPPTMQQVLDKYDPINESPLFSVMAGVETFVSNLSAISVDRNANMQSYPYLHFWVESCSIHQEQGRIPMSRGRDL